jgi:hypothetical protein
MRDVIQGAEALALVLDMLSSRRRLLQEPFAFSARIYATGPCATVAAKRCIVVRLHDFALQSFPTQLCNMHPKLSILSIYL